MRSGSATGCAPRGRAPRHLPALAGERHHLDFVDLVGRSVWVYGQTEVPGISARPGGRGQSCLRGQRHRVARRRDRPAVRHVQRPGGRGRTGWTRDVVVGCDGSLGVGRAACPAACGRPGSATYPYAWLGHPRRRRAVHRRADLRLAPRRVRAALDALDRRSAGSTCRCHRTPTWPTGPTTGSGTSWAPARPRAGRLDADARARSPSRASCRCAASCRRRCATGGCSSPGTPRTSCRRPVPRASTSRSPTWPCSPRPCRPVSREGPDAGRRLLRHRAAPGLAVHPLLLVDDDHAAHRRRPLRHPAAAVPAALGDRRQAGATGLAENYAGLPIGF